MSAAKKKRAPAARPKTKRPTPRASATEPVLSPPPTKRRAAPGIAELQVREIEALRRDVAKKSAELLPRWSPDPEDVQKSVAQLVLALVEFLRKLLERQAIRRMEHETLTPDEIERIGLALMRLEETVHDLARRFGLDPEELNLDLGPLGRLS